MWLWAAWRGHLAVCVSGQLRYLFALIPLAVSRQHGHRHRRHRHGNGIPRLPGCHQGEQVPASERELNLRTYAKPIITKTHIRPTTNSTPFFFFTLSLHPPLDIFLSRSPSSPMQILAEMSCGDSLSHMCLYTYTCCSQASENSAVYQRLSSSWNLSGSRRVTGGVQCALYRTSGADKGRLELSSGFLPFCKLTPTRSCRFNGFGHSPVKELSIKRAFCASCVFELLYVHVAH